MITEKRLIDANELLRNAKEYGPILGGLADEYDVRWLVDAQITVDAVEVVHSQWDTVFYESHGTLASYSHLCPVCKYFYKDTRFKGHNYCPSCGAKMDGEHVEQ